LGLREADSCNFPVRGLAQRRLAFDWHRSYGTNEIAAGAGGIFFREAVSAHRPVFLSRRRLPPSPLSPVAPSKARRKKPAIPVERELEPTAFRRSEIPEELRRRKAVGARSRVRDASVRDVPRSVAAG